MSIKVKTVKIMCPENLTGRHIKIARFCNDILVLSILSKEMTATIFDRPESAFKIVFALKINITLNTDHEKK